MELRALLRLLRRRLLLIVITVAVGASLGYGTSSRTPVYATTSTIYVGFNSFAEEDLSLEAGRNVALSALSVTFASMIESDGVAADAIELAGVDRSVEQVVGATTAAVQPGTTLIEITVVDAAPAAAQALANGLAEAFVSEAQTLEPVDGQAGTIPRAPAVFFEPARLPVVPLATGTVRNIVLGAVLGLVVTIGLLLLVDYLDVTTRSPDEVERRLDLPVLGMIPASRQLADLRITGPDG